MRKTITSLLILVSTLSMGFRKIPDTIPVGSYTVSMKLDDSWMVQAFEKQGAIFYSYVDRLSKKDVAIEIRVYRVSLPANASILEAADVAIQMVRDDGLKYQKTVFKRRVLQLTKPDLVECPNGAAYIFGDDRSSFFDGTTHFARAALLLPKDYRIRLIAYLVVGHQTGGGDVRPEQNEYFATVIKGIREIVEPVHPAIRSDTKP
jgi:hypothetical protein